LYAKMQMTMVLVYQPYYKKSKNEYNCFEPPCAVLFLWVGLGGDIPYLVHRVWYDTDRKGGMIYEKSK
ncbi:MAG: hypothetical protein II168_10285, partial [Ruminococcus sp.]|nr:hypothetical protein [Ruminococcus sp.]